MSCPGWARPAHRPTGIGRVRSKRSDRPPRSGRRGFEFAAAAAAAARKEGIVEEEEEEEEEEDGDAAGDLFAPPPDPDFPDLAAPPDGEPWGVEALGRGVLQMAHSLSLDWSPSW